MQRLLRFLVYSLFFFFQGFLALKKLFHVSKATMYDINMCIVKQNLLVSEGEVVHVDKCFQNWAVNSVLQQLEE